MAEKKIFLMFWPFLMFYALVGSARWEVGDGWTVGGKASKWKIVGLLGGRERWMTAGCAMVGSAGWEVGDGWTVGGIARWWEIVGLLGGR